MFSVLVLLAGSCLIALCDILKLINNIDIIVCFVIGFFTVAFLFDINNSYQLKNYLLPFIGGYLFRIGVLFYDVYSSNPLKIPELGSVLTSDMLSFYSAAVGYTHGIPISYGGYFSKLFGIIFSLTACSRLWGEFIVLLFSLATLYIYTLIMNDINISYENRQKGMYLLCFLPNFVILSVIFRRESIIVFLLSLSLYFFIKWINNILGEKAFLLSCLFALIASLFHGATGLIICGYILVHLLYSPRLKKIVLKWNNIAISIMCVVLFWGIFIEFGNVFFAKLNTLSGVETISSTRGAGGANYAQYVGDSSTIMRMVEYSVPRYLYFMFSPFPWQWRGIGDIMAFFFSGFVYLSILMKSFYYIHKRHSKYRDLIVMLLLVSVVIAFIFSWGVTNTGTALRHRDKFIVLYAILYTLILE